MSILSLQAQKHCFIAYVYDAQTKKPMQYVNLWVPSLQTGSVSDENGKFILLTDKPIDSIKISYIGYQTLHVPIKKEIKTNHFYLSKNTSTLPEVRVFAGESPANRLVRLVQKHAKENNPYYYSSYRCKQYSKSFFSSEIVNDSLTEVFFLNNTNDTMGNKELYDVLKNQHFFLAESLIERNYKFPGKKNDLLLASKISGFKDPFFQVVLSQMLSFSFYDEKYILLYGSYINPLSDKNFSHYFFWIEDTAFVGIDTLFTVSFKPYKNKEFHGVTGYMTIHSANWAIQDVVVSPVIDASFLSFVTEQHYDRINGKYWFPTKTNSKLTINNFKVNLMPITCYTSIKNKEINIGLRQRNSQFVSDEIYLDSPETYERKSDSILAKYRDDTISIKDVHTYAFWDTVKKDIDMDKFFFITKTLISGEIPYKWIDFKLDRILKFTGQEIARVGIGIETNDRLSEYFSVGGFLGYGFKDTKCKWGLNGSVLFAKRRKLRLSMAASHDLFKAGSNVDYRTNDEYQFSFSKANNLILVMAGLLKHYDYTKQAEVGFSGLINRWLEAKVSISYTMYNSGYKYAFTPMSSSIKPNFSYTISEVSLFLKISPKSTLYSFGNFDLNQETNRPEVVFRYSRGIKGLLGSNFTYNRFDLIVLQIVNIQSLGDFRYRVKAGFVDNDLPYSSLYSLHGAWLYSDFFDENALATMRVDEFVSDKYVSAQVSQKFPKLYKSEFSIPIPQLLLHGAWGDIRHPEFHQGSDIQIKSMNHGFFEAGLALHNLLQTDIIGIGIGVFYRFGYYAFPKVIDNFSFRLSVRLFGI